MASSMQDEIGDATKGFDALFSNDLDGAKAIFGAKKASAFHLLGLGATIFLQASLGMESGVVDQAVKALNEAEAAARAQVKASKSAKSSVNLTRYPPGTEWEILHADAVVLQGLTNALSETYYGYMQSLYALNSAHSKFSKLHKTVFPRGLEPYRTPSASPAVSRATSQQAIPTMASTSASTSKPIISFKGGLLGRLSGTSSPASLDSQSDAPPNGVLEEMIVSGAAFGHGLFNLVLSLLPAKVRGLVGVFGFKADRGAALKSLAVAAAISTDPHAVFAGLVLMTYTGLILRALSWQADEEHTVKQYLGIIDRLEARYPKGTLWILNRAKIHQFTRRSDEAIEILEGALTPGASNGFVQADSLLVFELAWSYLSQARYSDAAATFLRMGGMNAWSPATYHMLVLGCYIALGQLDDAQKLLDRLPLLLSDKRPGGGEIPTESYVRQRLGDWKAKQGRRKTNARMVDVIKIPPIDELSIIWNNHNTMSNSVAVEQIKRLAALSPRSKISSPFTADLPPLDTKAADDLDCAEEIASRALLLGILHRTVGEHNSSRKFLGEAMSKQAQISTSWIPAATMFELATLELVQAEDMEKSTEGTGTNREGWKKTLDTASNYLDQVAGLVSSAPTMASRIESRVSMLRDEIGYKRTALGL